MILKLRSPKNFYFNETSNFKLGMWGSFGISFDLPKLEDSDMTREATLKTDSEIEIPQN